MNEADPSLLKYLEHVGPWLGTAGGFIGALCGYLWNGLTKQVKELAKEMKLLKEALPSTYANKIDTTASINRLQDTMEKHMDTISTDVRTLHGDVKNVLLLLGQRKD
jgi:hypothetical protein